MIILSSNCAVSIAYENPGTKLGNEVVFAANDEPRVVLATHKYKGEMDVALVALDVTSADFKKDRDVITLDIPENRLVVVPDFPRLDGWYMPHAETGVPHGRKVEESTDARYLYRSTGSSYVGLWVYNNIYYCKRRQCVYVVCRASDELGVVAEVPKVDIAKIKELILDGS